MSNIQGTLLICDDVRVEVGGKVILIGVYTTDIAIPSEQFMTPQLHFILNSNCPLAEKPKNVTAEITLPKQQPLKWEFPIIDDGQIPEGRTKFVFKRVLSVFNAVLVPGRIEARLRYDENELPVAAGWIVAVPMPQIIPPSAAPQ
jgi:hypothetical protein